MGNPIQDAENALGEIINDVQTQRTEIEDNFVKPLQEFPKTAVDGLDTTHDDCIKAVQSAMSKLFAPGVTFEGDGANAIADMIGDFYERESKLSNYADDGISTYMVQLAQLCSSTAKDMEPNIDAIRGISNSNILVNDVIHYWSDVFHKGPQALIDDLQVGPWTIGDLTGSSGVQQSQTMMGQVQQQPMPPGQSPISGFWETVTAVLAPFAGLIVVANIVTEAIKQCSLEVHLANLSWSIWHWFQQMDALHNNILQQNKSTNPSGDFGDFQMAYRSDNARFLLKQVSGLPNPNLNDKQKERAKELFKVLKTLYGNVVTMAEVEFIMAHFPANVAENKLFLLADLKVKYPKLPDGYLAFFVIQGLPASQIKQDIQWLMAAAQNSQGNGPGNIYYMKGNSGVNPVVDFVSAETFRYEIQAANQLRAWKAAILGGSSLNALVPPINTQPNAVKKFLQKTFDNRSQLLLYDPNNSATNKFLPGGYAGLFGTATQEMIKVSIITAPWYSQFASSYQLSLDTASGSSLRPDIQMKLPGSNNVTMDYTSYDQRFTKKKYNYAPYNIVIIHNGPFGGSEAN